METRVILSTLKKEEEKSSTTCSKDILIKRKFFTALRYAKYSCILGASNKKEDVFRTNGYISFIDFRNIRGKYVKGQNPDNINYGGMYKLKQTKWWYHPNIDNAPENASIDIYFRHKGQDPFVDKKFDLSVEQRSLLTKALLTLQQKYGNC